MKLQTLFSLAGLVTWVDAHGYLTIPSSRTRLGFEVWSIQSPAGKKPLFSGA